MTNITIGGSRKAIGALADQLKAAVEAPNQYGRFETTVYAHNNSRSNSQEVIITFSNDDAESDDGGYQGDTINDILVDIDD